MNTKNKLRSLSFEKVRWNKSSDRSLISNKGGRVVEPTFIAKLMLRWLWQTRREIDLGIYATRSSTKPTTTVGRTWLFGEKFRNHYGVDPCPDFWVTIHQKGKKSI